MFATVTLAVNPYSTIISICVTFGSLLFFCSPSALIILLLMRHLCLLFPPRDSTSCHCLCWVLWRGRRTPTVNSCLSPLHADFPWAGSGFDQACQSLTVERAVKRGWWQPGGHVSCRAWRLSSVCCNVKEFYLWTSWLQPILSCNTGMYL